MEKKSRELVMAKLYFKNGDYKMAEKKFNEYLNMNPEDVSALKLLAQVYEQNKRYDKAFETYERCYLAEPDRTGVLLDICRILLMNEIWLDGVDYRKWLNLAIKAFPSNPIVINFKAFLATLPQDEQCLGISNPQAAKSSVLTEDLAELILQKLNLLEIQLKNIEQRLEKPPATSSLPEPAPTPPAPIAPSFTPLSNLPTPAKPPTLSLESSFCQAPSTPPAPVAPLFTLHNNLSTPPKPPTLSLETSLSQVTSTPPAPVAPLFTLPSFNFISGAPLGNPFEASLKKLNLPLEGAWTLSQPPSQSSPQPPSQPSPQPPSQPPSQQSPQPPSQPPDELVPVEELPIEQNCIMTPIEVRTGEEDEDKVFEHRAKLFRFRDKEYKERGLGNIKILKNKTTGMCRLVMRRDATGLVCLNCFEITKIQRVKPNQVKWTGIDASDNQPEGSIFLLKLKTPEVTDIFQSHLETLFNEANTSNSNLISQGSDGQAKDTRKSESSSDKSDIELVDPKLDQSLVDKARLLKLPDLFYHKLKNQECGGCDGCKDED